MKALHILKLLLKDPIMSSDKKYINEAIKELEEKYKSGDYGDYIVIYYSTAINNWNTVARNRPLWDNNVRYKLIHKKHKDILDAYLADNSVEIEVDMYNDSQFDYEICTDFINSYYEDFDYRLINKKQQCPIFKRNTDGVVIILENDEVEYVDCVLTQYSEYIGYRWSKSIFNFSNFETIPYDKERGLYHLQPVWFKGDTKTSIGFYSVTDRHPLTKDGFHCIDYKSIEPITQEQLKVMPWLFDRYQQVLKDKQ